MKLLKKIMILLFISFCSMILFNIKVFALTGIVTEVTVNVREKASTDSKRIMYVTQDDKVEVLEKNGEWYKIKYKNKTGYVFGKYVKVDESKIPSNDKEEKIEEASKPEENIEQEDTDNEDNVLIKKINLKKDTKVRILPNILSNVIYTCNNNIEVNVIEELNNWSYISSNTITGWVRTEILDVKEVNIDNKKDLKEENKQKNNKQDKDEDKIENNNNKVSYVKYDTVNLRKSASATSTILAKLKLNDEVTVIEQYNSVWTKVKVDGKIGYISTELLSDTKQNEVKKEKKEDTTSRSSNTTSREKEDKDDKKENEGNTLPKDSTVNKTDKVTGNDIVDYAKKFLGYQYVYGASSPSIGFDCSGFTSYVYKHFGYTLSRSSGGQANNGVKVEKKNMQPGDILIFKNQALTKVGHVGIYIGNNKMIHSSEPGVGVVITDLNAKGYNYSKRFVMARRIIK